MGLQSTIYRRSLCNATQATESYAADLTLPTADLISKFLENKQMLKSYNRCLSATWWNECMNTVNVTTQNGTALTTNKQWVAVWMILSMTDLTIRHEQSATEAVFLHCR